MRMVGVGVMLACLALGGCRALGPKKDQPPPPAAGVRPNLDLNATTNPGPVTPVNSTAGSGILAGQVTDTFNRRPPPTYIQVAATSDNAGSKAAPIEIAADKDGYFLIQGLQPGQHYQLIARAKDGTQLMAGSVWVTPPNPRVLIRISGELATTSTPPLPSAPTPPVPPPAPRAAPAAPPPVWPHARNDQAWAPGRTSGPNGLTPDRPAGLAAPAPEPPPRVPVDPTRISAGESVRNDPPVSSIPGGGWAPATDAGPAGGEPPPIPYCSLTGRQLNNFALYDLNGQPWEWRQRHNKLTLIDFWGTWCPSCLHAIPHLNVLNDRYSKYGLEVVGIAYENPAPQATQVEQIRRVTGRLNTHYTLLLGGDRLSCPVRVQFRVAQWPTLFLIDGTGRIIWQDSGLDRQKASELDRLIRQKLNVR